MQLSHLNAEEKENKEMPKAKYITFVCGKWVVRIKNKSISRHSDFAEAVKARDEYISNHPELELKV